MGKVPNQESVSRVSHQISIFAHDTNFINLQCLKHIEV